VRHGADPRVALAEALGVSVEDIRVRAAPIGEPLAAPDPEAVVPHVRVSRSFWAEAGYPSTRREGRKGARDKHSSARVPPARCGPFSRKLVAPVAGSSSALWRVGDGSSRRAILPCWLNENAPVWLCLRQQLSSQPPTHRRTRSPLAKRRQGSQSQPAPTERQGALLAKNSAAFCSPFASS
jgi:hypothetical protein